MSERDVLYLEHILEAIAAIKRVLGMKDPAALLREVRSGRKLGRKDASANVSRMMKTKSRAKRSD